MENRTSLNLSDFWRNIGEECRLLHAAYPALRADWHYIVGSRGPGEWRIAGEESGAVIQFEALARRAASRLPGIDAGELLTVWLENLMRKGVHFKYGEGGIEIGPDGSEKLHLNGTISRVFEASASYCSMLEGGALQTELRARQQADEAREAAAPGTEQSVTSPETQTPTELPEGAKLPVIKAAAVANARKRGPGRDFETAMKVDEVVTRLTPNGNWRALLDEVCDALDDDQVRRPKPWNKKGYATWSDCMILERPLVIKAIEHHLKLAREHKKTFS